MQGGVEQGVEEDEPCVRRLSDTELAMGWLGNGKDDESRDKNLMPANNILLPVMSGCMPKFLIPILMSG